MSSHSQSLYFQSVGSALFFELGIGTENVDSTGSLVRPKMTVIFTFPSPPFPNPLYALAFNMLIFCFIKQLKINSLAFA